MGERGLIDLNRLCHLRLCLPQHLPQILDSDLVGTRPTPFCRWILQLRWLWLASRFCSTLSLFHRFPRSQCGSLSNKKEVTPLPELVNRDSCWLCSSSFLTAATS